MFSAHAIHVLVRNTLIFFIILLIALYAWLSVGVKIDTLKASGYRIDGLYIKLDKKLTLKARKIIIPKRKENPSFDRIDETLENVKYLLTFFDNIDLKKIVFDNNILGIYYYDGILQISSKDYLIRGNVHREGKMLIGDIPILQLKDRNITMRGTFTYDLHEDVLMTKGKFALGQCIGDFNAIKQQKDIKFFLKSIPFDGIESVIDQFHLIPAVRSWVVDKVKAKTYQLLSLNGEGKIVDKTFVMNMQALKGKVLFKDVSIHFKEGLEPVRTPSFILSYSDKKGLVFDLEKPRYLGHNLDGSRVSIVNLRDDNTTLKIDLHIQSPIDKTVHTLLDAYDIHIPVLQEQGEVNATVKIDKPLKDKGLKVLTDVRLGKGKIIVNHVPFFVKNGHVSYVNGRVYLNHIVLSHQNYYGVLSGNIDVRKRRADMLFDMKYFLLKTNKTTLVTMKNEKIPVVLTYQNNIHISIPKYRLKFFSSQYKNILNIDDLSRVKRWILPMIASKMSGHMKIQTKDFKTFTLNGVIKPESCFLYEKENTCYKDISLYASMNAKKSDIYLVDKKIHYNQEKSRIDINNVNIDLKIFLENMYQYKNKKTINNKKSLVIVGKNSRLRYGKYRLLTDSYDITVDEKNNIKAVGSCAGDIVKFSKKKDIIYIQALRIKDKILQPLINFYGLQGGRYSLTKVGNPLETMKGEILIEGGMMKDFKTYQSASKFVNNLPELEALHHEKISTKGFYIKAGSIVYRMIKSQTIIFDTIYIKGEHITISGKGKLDLITKNMNIVLNIQMAKKIGKMIGSIPVLGYILMGKDKSINIGVKITGSYEHPHVTTMAVKDILVSPFEMIKRTLESPAHIINK
jgi:hypothetical protein